MKYLEFYFQTEPCTETANDLLAGMLADVGFESFVPQPDGISAYIQKDSYHPETLEMALAQFPMEGVRISHTCSEAEDKDWNEEWEKNFFQPIVIDRRCVVHSTFHHDVPKAEYDIVINPQMAFGTGHHQTTSLILEALLDADIKGKTVLDMGCGTSILAILASMRGARAVTAIDIDDWCVENSKDNVRLNGITNIFIEQGDASSLKGRNPFDLIIANINRNVLLADMHAYAQAMHPGSEIYMSGFYTNDIPLLQEEARKHGLQFVHSAEKEHWAMARFCLQ